METVIARGKEMTNSYKPTKSVVKQISELSVMPMDDLQRLWRKLYDHKPGSNNRKFMERHIAHKLQKNELERTKAGRAVLKRNDKNLKVMRRKLSPRNDKDKTPMKGTVLTRLHNGIEHHVTVLGKNEFQYDGGLYSSLSEVAREITGTRWSGPRFFGLNK